MICSEPFPEIYTWLKTLGQDVFGNAPFKLVWSEDETELRHGTFSDFDNLIFLRTVTETRRTKKYPYIKERWILEKYFPAEKTFNLELPESRNGCYEPFFVFESGKGDYLLPTIKVVEFIVNMASGKTRKMTPGERLALHEKAEDKEVQDFADSLDCSPIQNALHMKQGVGYSATEEQILMRRMGLR